MDHGERVGVDDAGSSLGARDSCAAYSATPRRRYPRQATMDEAPQPGEFTVGESFATILTETTQSLVCVLDRDGRILLFNEACERATGFSHEEVIGRDAREFVIPPEEREAFTEFLAYVWKTRVPSPQVGHWQTKDGGRRLIAWSNKPMAGAGGALVSLVTTGIDLTDRAPRSARARARAGGRSRGEARRDRPARDGTARAAARGHARRFGGEPRAGLHGGVRGVRKGAPGQRVRRPALRA